MKLFCFLVLIALVAGFAGCTNPFNKTPSAEKPEAEKWEEVELSAEEIEKQSKHATDALEATIHDALRRADLSEVRTGLELYYDMNLVYPAVSSYELLKPLLVPMYLRVLPDDPAGESYHYFLPTDQQNYLLGAWMEETSEYYLVRSSYTDNTDDMPAEIKGVSPYQYAEREAGESEQVPLPTAAGRDAFRKMSMQEVRTALEIRFDETLSYPTVANYDDLSEFLVGEYIRSLPENPSPTEAYHYVAGPEGATFSLGCWLETEPEYFEIYGAGYNGLNDPENPTVPIPDALRGENPYLTQ